MTTFWYVEPLSDLTNENFAAELAREGLTAEAQCSIKVDGARFLVYAVPFRFITLLQRSEMHRKQFRVYVKEDGGKPRRWNLEQKRRKGARSARSVRKTQESLLALTKKKR